MVRNQMGIDRGGQRLGTAGSYSSTNSRDPDALLAQMTREDYSSYQKDYGQFERDLVERARTDTSLIDQARVDSKESSALMSGVAERNRERYGSSLTGAQKQQQDRGLELSSTLGSAQAVNSARLVQKDTNTALLGGVIDVGQGVYQRSMQGLSNSAQNKNQLDNAYKSAKAQHKAQTYSSLGSLGAAAIMAMTF